MKMKMKMKKKKKPQNFEGESVNNLKSIKYKTKCGVRYS